MRWLAVAALITGCARVSFGQLPNRGAMTVHTGIAVSPKDLLVSVAQAFISATHTFTVTCQIGDVAVR